MTFFVILDKKLGERNGLATVASTYLLSARFPQCSASLALPIVSPFPSHPTGRSVFPNPAARQHSLQSMHRCFLVSDESTRDVDDSHRIQCLVWKSFPSKASAFASIDQIPTKADVDESLQSPKGLTRIGMTIIIHPTSNHLIDLLNKFTWQDGCLPFGKSLKLTTNASL